MMTLKQIASLGKELAKFLVLFVGYFRSQPGFALGRVYVQGLLSNVARKNVEAIAMEFNKPPRTLQRFLESVKWDESGVRDRCQQLIAQEHAHAEAIGCIDESGTAKSGDQTVGAGRQWLGSRGKVDNGVVGVHLSYCAPGFQCLLDSEVYLPEDWAKDPERQKKLHTGRGGVPHQASDRPGAGRSRVGQWCACPGLDVRRIVRTRLGLSRRSRTAWADLRGRSAHELPRLGKAATHAPQRPIVASRPPRTSGSPSKVSALGAGQPSSEVQNLLRYSPIFRRQRWQRYRIKDTTRGPEVWEVKWTRFWRKGSDGLPGRRHCLIVARNVLTQEVKYFVSNRVPGAQGISLRRLLRIAFGRWSVENCFRQAKEELGLDHYEARGWRCVHRHFHLTQLSHLFCARVRQKFDAAISRNDPLEHLTTEQVRRAVNIWLQSTGPRLTKIERLEKEIAKQDYYQKRNSQAHRSHTKTRRARLKNLGINVDRIKSCLPLCA